MLFHGLPAWAGVGRACQHRRSGNFSRSSIGGRRGGREEGATVEEEKCDTVQKGFCPSDGSQDEGLPNMILSSLSAAPTEPLLCKFADGGQKKRQSQSKYPQNGRPWHREGEVRCYTSAKTILLQHVPERERVSLFLLMGCTVRRSIPGKCLGPAKKN